MLTEDYLFMSILSFGKSCHKLSFKTIRKGKQFLRPDFAWLSSYRKKHSALRHIITQYLPAVPARRDHLFALSAPHRYDRFKLPLPCSDGRSYGHLLRAGAMERIYIDPGIDLSIFTPDSRSDGMITVSVIIVFPDYLSGTFHQFSVFFCPLAQFFSLLLRCLFQDSSLHVPEDSRNLL